jgi:hypothetical protein
VGKSQQAIPANLRASTNYLILHLHPSYNAMQLSGWQSMKVNEIRGEFFDHTEDLPDWVFGRDFLNAVENDLFLDAVFNQQFFNVYNRHVTGQNFKDM